MEVEEIFPNEDDNSDFELDPDVLKALDNEGNVTSQRTIKDELRSKIQSRRVSEGQGELKVEFEPPKQYELTLEERSKIETRKSRNRKSADMSRLKRKRHLEELIHDEKELSEQNQKLKADVDALQKVKQRMETAWSMHMSTCSNKSLKPVSAAKEINDTRSVSECTSTADETITSSEGPSFDSWNKGNGYNRGNPGMGILNINPARLHGMPKQQKIAMLTAYLKGNHSKPEVQKMIGKINEMTSCRNKAQIIDGVH